MIEAAWVDDTDTQSLLVKCGNCHKKMVVLSNAPNASKTPLCMCSHCGEELYSPNDVEALRTIVVKHGWMRGVVWLLQHNEGAV